MTASIDSFGAIYNVPLNADSGVVGYLFHKGDTKDHGNADQSYTLKAGANEIWRLEGDSTNYTSNPRLLPVPDSVAISAACSTVARLTVTWPSSTTICGRP